MGEVNNWWILHRGKVLVGAGIVALGVLVVVLVAWLMGSRFGGSPVEAEGNQVVAPTAEPSQSMPQPRKVTPTATASTPFEVAEGSCMDSEAVDRTDADAVGYVMASVSHCWDSMTDATTTAGAMRGRSLMSADWAAQQVEPERNALQGQFSAASEHQGYTVPTVSYTGADTNQDVAEDKKARGYTVEWKWKGRDGKTLPGGRQQVTYYLERHGGQWEVVGEQVTITELED